VKLSEKVNGARSFLNRGKANRFKQISLIMIAAGLLLSTAYFFKTVYLEYAAARAEIVLNFPQIAQSKYPDGSRFTYYDFIDDKNLEEALKVMKKQGKYENFTPEDVRRCFFLYSDLESSAGASVSVARSSGDDFSYVANEYKITFIQPHDYKNKNILRRIFAKNYSEDFLKALIEVNRKRIAEEKGGIEGFKILTDVNDEGNYDYSEELGVYKTKIGAIKSYLSALDKKEPDFMSERHGLSLLDLRKKYDFLITNNLDGISDFVESSGLSRDVSQASNKLRVNISNAGLKFNKNFDRAEINDYAMKNYDQTFTENLINVVQNDEYGLYQARPKTAFDMVTLQKHEAEENIAYYSSKINEYNKDLAIFGTLTQTPEELARLTNKCDSLMDKFKEEYNSLTKLAHEIVAEYHNEVNESFILAKVKPRKLIRKQLIIKLAAIFMIGGAIAFVIAVFVYSYITGKKIRQKKKIIESIRQSAPKEGV